MDIFQVLFYQPIFNLLMFVSQNLGGIGWAIIIVAAVSKLITYPLTKGQIEQRKKSKELQSQVKEIQKKYKYNQEVMTKELAKVQAKALPGQLKGCLSIIVFIIFFIQIRGTVVDLMNRGYHAFNTVAYSESLKKNEDSISFEITDNSGNTKLPLGKNTIAIHLEASNGAVLDEVYNFEVVSDVNARIEQIKIEELDKSENQRKLETDNITAMLTAKRAADIAIYNPKLDSGLKSIAIKTFLIFPTESVQRYLITDDSSKFDFYMRPPSGQTLLADKTRVTLNGVDITSQATITQGDTFNLQFAGMNLAMVAADFNLLDLGTTAPYIVLAVISAYTQYLVSKMYSATNVTTTPMDDDKGKKDKDKNKKKAKSSDTEEPDMAQAMTDSLQITNKLLPIFTLVLSLGYLGGATFLPSGVTLFWTAQNVFVIIQQAFMNRKELAKKYAGRFLTVNTSKDGSK